MPRVTFLEKSGDRRVLVSAHGILVMPGIHDMTAADWEAVAADRGSAGLLARGELFAGVPLPAATRERAPMPLPPPEVAPTEPPDAPEEHTAEELEQFCRDVSAMPAEEAIALISGVSVVPALIALLAKDNRAAIVEACADRLAALG